MYAILKRVYQLFEQRISKLWYFNVNCLQCFNMVHNNQNMNLLVFSSQQSTSTCKQSVRLNIAKNCKLCKKNCKNLRLLWITLCLVLTNSHISKISYKISGAGYCEHIILNTCDIWQKMIFQQVGMDLIKHIPGYTSLSTHLTFGNELN